jgi:transcriptional regulator with XRE-family HTH domain
MDKEIILKILSENIRAERARKKYTQETLAESAGITQKYLCRIENAKANPTVSVIANLALALNTTIDKLVPLN